MRASRTYRIASDFVAVGLLITLAACLGCESKPGGPSEYTLGREYLANKEWSKALAAFNRFIAGNPGNAPAFYDRATLYRERPKLDRGQAKRDRDGAIADYQAALRLHKQYVGAASAEMNSTAPLPRSQLFDTYRCLGDLLAKDGKDDEAIEFFTEAIQLPPDPGDAYEVFGEATVREPQRAKAYFGRGMALLRKNLLNPAIDDLTEAVQRDVDSYEAVYQRGCAGLKAEKFDDAAEDCRRAIGLNPERSDAFYKLAVTLLSSPVPQLSDAVASLREARRLRSPDVAPPKHELAQAYFDCGKTLAKNCRRDAATAASEDVGPPGAKYRQELADTVDCFNEARRFDPDLGPEIIPELARAYFQQGVGLDKAGYQAEANGAFGKAAELDPKYAQRRREYEEEKTKLARRDDPSSTVLHPIVPPIDRDPALTKRINSAWDAFSQGQLDYAIGKFSDILTTHPDSAEAWYGRGWVFLEKSNPESAIDDFDQAIQVDPHFNQLANVYCQRGRACLMVNRFDQARQDCTRAIQLKPDLVWAYYYRAVACLKSRDFDCALDDLDAARTLHTIDLHWDASIPGRWYADVYEGKGIAEIEAGHWDEALSNLEKAIGRDPDRARHLNWRLAQAYRRRGETQQYDEPGKAIDDLNAAVRLEPRNAQNYRVRGLILYRMEQWPAAAADLDHAIGLEPDLEPGLRPKLTDAKQKSDAEMQYRSRPLSSEAPPPVYQGSPAAW